MIKQELTYWVTLALIPKMWTKRKNEIYVNCFQHVPQISIIDLFENSANWDLVGMNDIEKTQFEEAKVQLANNSFLVEELIAQGYDILPITHENYPRLLKDNLKFNAPTVIYTKGNKSLLQAPSIAIVGSRNADAKSLSFTDNIAKKATNENKVVVSGFAKGVDRQALDSSVGINGKSIIVLPQGIMTFGSGFKQYFKHIAQGRVLVMSTFAPKAPWSVEFAMARNPIIYGMASEIFVAQSDDKGGTWSGVIDGLRKKRPIYVRYPEKKEKNANLLLIQKGASAVDFYGNSLTLSPEEQKTPDEIKKEKLDSELIAILNSVEKISVKEIIGRLSLDWKDDKMKRYLDNMQQVEKIKIKNRIYYRLKGKVEIGLFYGQI
jgi:predicted Rossmann fold nucleotide-binding protein DprA/Smf involved in DNA uptake